MKRPLAVLLMMYMMGIIVAKMQIFVLMAILCFVALIISWVYVSKRRVVFLMIFFVLIGYGTSHAQISKVSQLKPLNEQNIKVNAQVIQPPIEKENKIELFLKINQVELDGRTYELEEKILGNLYYDENTPIINIAPGDILYFQGKVRIPDGIRNPGGFDYNLYLRTKKIYASITAFPDTLEKIGYNSPGMIPKAIYTFKNYVTEIIEKNLASNHADLLKGILFGEKDLNVHIRDTFVDSGIAHVLAVSGLHVGFLILFVSYLSNLFHISHKYRILLVTLLLIIYIFITGASPSVIRASIMSWIFLLSRPTSQRYDGISALCLAGLFILLPNPLLLFNASFQLSFTAALSIILFYPVILGYLQKIKYIPKAVISLLAVTLVAQIGTLPASLYHFHQISLISIVTNLLVVPSLGILLLISVLAVLSYICIPIVAGYLFFLSGLMFHWIIKIAQVFSSIPFSHISLPPFTWWGMILYILFFLTMGGYIPLQIKKVKIITFAAIFILLLFAGFQYILPQPLKVTFLDVSQGDSILIETPERKNILIDGGGYPSYREDGRKISENVLLPALYFKRIKKLDLVIVSHPHDDHIKGIQQLIGKVPIGALGIYDVNHENMKNIISLAKKNNIQILYLKEGKKIKVEKNIGFRVLFPGSTPPTGDSQGEMNNSSLVMRMDFHEISFLFTGDIEKEAENQLIESRESFQSTVLKIAHHGSDTSSDENFIKKVNPKVCVISVGKNNNFGHPAPSTLEKLKRFTPHVFRTDEKGAVEITSNGTWIKINPYLLR